jgi:hypothetical protein
MGNKLVLVCGDDWEGIYNNGNFVDEGHEIRRFELIRFMQTYQTLDVEFMYLNSKGQEWMEDRGCLPSLLEDIPSEYIDR